MRQCHSWHSAQQYQTALQPLHLRSAAPGCRSCLPAPHAAHRRSLVEVGAVPTAADAAAWVAALAPGALAAAAEACCGERCGTAAWLSQQQQAAASRGPIPAYPPTTAGNTAASVAHIATLAALGTAARPAATTATGTAAARPKPASAAAAPVGTQAAPQVGAAGAGGCGMCAAVRHSYALFSSWRWLAVCCTWAPDRAAMDGRGNPHTPPPFRQAVEPSPPALAKATGRPLACSFQVVSPMHHQYHPSFSSAVRPTTHAGLGQCVAAVCGPRLPPLCALIGTTLTAPAARAAVDVCKHKCCKAIITNEQIIIR